MSDRPFAVQPTTQALFGRKGDISAAMLFLGNIVVVYLCFGNFLAYIENALFETSQNIYLFGASVLYFVAARRTKDPVSKVFWLALCMLCLSVLLREMEPRNTNLEFLFGPIFELRLHYAFLGVIWLALLTVAWPYLIQLFQTAWRWFFSLSGILMLLGVLLYIGGDIAEKKFFSGNYEVSEMIEESMELLGTLFIFFSAYAALRRRA